MKRTKQPTSPGPRFTYGAIEAALMEVFDVSKGQLGAFRGRTTNLRRLRLVSGIGRGSRVTYDLEQARKWLIALELCAAGTDPIVAVKTVKRDWAELTKQIALATDEVEVAFGNHVILFFHPALMGKKPLMTFRQIRVVHGAMAVIEELDKGKFAGVVDPENDPVPPTAPSHKPAKEQVEPATGSPTPAENRADLTVILDAAKQGIVCLRDLTAVLMRFDAALQTRGVLHVRA